MRKRNSAFSLLAVALVAGTASAFEISPIPEGKFCAFSLTYDDAVRAHYTHALGMHRKYGYPATFFVVTDWVGTESKIDRYCSWAELKEMSDAGMEIASHTKSHVNMVDLEKSDGWETILSEVTDSRDAIERNCLNHVRSYAFAGNYYPSSTYQLMQEVRGYVRTGATIRLQTGQDSTTASIRNAIESKVLVENGVGCAMIHGLGVGGGELDDGWNPIPSLDVYESIFTVLKEHEDKIHIDTFGDNAAYSARARHSSLVAKGNHVYEVTLDESGTTSDIYDAGEVWVRVAADETVEINGQPAVPNAFGAICAKTGDLLKMTRSGMSAEDEFKPIPYSSAMVASASTKYSNRDPIYAINGAGLDEDGELHANGSADKTMWMPQESDKSPWYKVDLGKTYVLGQIKVWNFNFTKTGASYTNRGAKDVDVYVTTNETAAGTASPDSADWKKLGSFTFAQANGQTTCPGFIVDDFIPSKARSVLLVIKSNWGGGYGGLSELRFYEGGDEGDPGDDPPPDDPPPDDPPPDDPPPDDPVAPVPGGTVPDLTQALEYLANPNKDRWPNSVWSWNVNDLKLYRGKIYTGGGEWQNNTGPCPITALDPISGTYANEFSAGTDTLWDFKEMSDGRLMTGSVDIHESGPNYGHYFSKRDENAAWVNYANCVRRSLEDLGGGGESYAIHTWDIAEYKGRFFTAGYGISYSGVGDYGEKAMMDGTPDLTDCRRTYKSDYWLGGNHITSTFTTYRRFVSFLPFDDDLYCFPMCHTMDIDPGQYDFEEWRWDEDLLKFVCGTNTWANVAPDVTPDDMVLSLTTLNMSPKASDAQLWSPTKFGSRVLYILGEHTILKRPWALYSAVSENHRVKATRVQFEAGFIPFDLTVQNGVVYLVGCTFDATKKVMTNSVWKSTDGLAFTKLFTFTASRQASAIEYAKGYFFLGMGCRNVVSDVNGGQVTKGWTVDNNEIGGNIYRVRDPEVKGPQVVAETSSLTVDEGGTGVARFRLSEAPQSAVTLHILTGGAPQFSAVTKELVFTPENWSAYQEAVFAVAEEDETDADLNGVLTAIDADGTAGNVRVTILAKNNDVRVIEPVPENLADLTSPTGKYTATTAGAVTMNPFNDSTNFTDTKSRVCMNGTSFFITYDFETPTLVKAYGIQNFGANNEKERAPKAWKFYGSNDDATWVQLDVRRYESGWTSKEFRYYSFENETAYRYYKIEFSANNGNQYTQFAHLEYYGEAGDTPPAPPPDDPTPVDPPDVPVLTGGEILVYEGFSANDYTLGTDTADRKLDGARQHPGAPVDDIGLNDHGWITHNSARSRIYTEAKGLSLPAELIAAGHKNLGSSIGWDRSTSNAGGRSASQKLSAGVLAPSKAVHGKFYFRVLLSVDADAAAVMAKGDALVTAKGESSQSLNYYGAGFVKTPDSGNHYNALVDAKSGIGFFIMKNKAGELKCAVGLANGALNGSNPAVTQAVMGDVEAGRTYICYAEVAVNVSGSESVSAGYQDVEKYTSANKRLWKVKDLQCDFITNDDYPEQLAITGCYGANGYARADEFCVGTNIDAILKVGKGGMALLVR